LLFGDKKQEVFTVLDAKKPPPGTANLWGGFFKINLTARGARCSHYSTFCALTTIPAPLGKGHLMATDRTAIRLRIAQLEAQRARIDIELAALRTADKPPRPFRFLEAPFIPTIEGPVKHILRRRSDEGVN
jgi:hypothetical protein